MNRDKLQIAIDEAQRFIERAQAAHNGFEWRKFANRDGGYWVHNDTRQTAAAKRASMDLTRALAEIRKVDA